MAFGIWFAAYSVMKLPIGSFAQMGSGMFPLLTGSALAITGLALAIPGLLARFVHAQTTATDGAQTDDEQVEKPEWISLAVVTLAIAAFAVCIRLFGIAPATFALIVIASLASKKLTLLTALALATALTIAAWLIFIVGLGLPFDIFDWPF